MNHKWRAKQQHRLILPASWQQIHQGERYCNAIQQACTPWFDKILGERLLKIGGLSAEIICPEHFQQMMITPDQCLSSNRLNGQHIMLIENKLEELPLMDKSIDACLLINSFNFCQDPHQLLREVNRVLVDDGYLFISLFNPLSQLIFKPNIQGKHQKKCLFRHFLPCRVIDWLELLSFEVVAQSALLPRTILGKKLPLFGAPLYFIVAQKLVYPLRLNPLNSPYQGVGNLETVGAFKLNMRKQSLLNAD